MAVLAIITLTFSFKSWLCYLNKKISNCWHIIPCQPFSRTWSSLLVIQRVYIPGGVGIPLDVLLHEVFALDVDLFSQVDWVFQRRVPGRTGKRELPVCSLVLLRACSFCFVQRLTGMLAWTLKGLSFTEVLTVIQYTATHPNIYYSHTQTQRTQK